MSHFPLYVALKLAAYIGWCWTGAWWLAPDRARPGLLAVGLGIVRLLMGVFFGILIWLLASVVYARMGSMDVETAGVRTAITYVIVYVPVRWIEWGIIDVLLNVRERSLKQFLLGSGAWARMWRIGGIAISCLADIPVFMQVGGLPIGRFMC